MVLKLIDVEPVLDMVFEPIDIKLTLGTWIEEQSKDTNRQKETKQTEEMKKGEPEDCQEHLACRRVVHLTA
uniref:Uncharacterized protein n=1 Tax=Solanum tuberosum TaxID=4113 RepID=M1DLY2_SOLTU